LAFSTSDDLVPLVERALANNRDFKVATLQVEQARALNRIDRAQQLPSVSASVQRFRQKFDDPSLDARYGQKLSAATIGTSDFELDFFGRVRSLSDASRHRYLASAQGQRAFRGALISEVLRAYVIDRAAAAQAQQLRNAYLDTLTLLNLAERQRDVGTLSEDEVNLQRSDTEHSHASMQQAQTDAAGARNALQLLTGCAGAPPRKGRGVGQSQ
jgi:outer membrane protein TolC